MSHTNLSYARRKIVFHAHRYDKCNTSTKGKIWGDDFNIFNHWNVNIWKSHDDLSHLRFIPNSEFFTSKICNHPEFTSFLFLVAGIPLDFLAMFKLLKILSAMGISFWFLGTSFVSENNGLAVFLFKYWSLSRTVINTIYLSDNIPENIVLDFFLFYDRDKEVRSLDVFDEKAHPLTVCIISNSDC